MLHKKEKVERGEFPFSQCDGFQLLSSDEKEDRFDIYAITNECIAICPYCHASRMVKFGYTTDDYLDLPINQKKVTIHLKKQRYRCQLCKKTTAPPSYQKDDKRQMTTRLLYAIEQACLSQSFVSIANEVGALEKTIRDIFTDYYTRIKDEIKVLLPPVLGVCEITLIKPRFLLLDIEKNKVVDILIDNQLTTLIDYFYHADIKPKIILTDLVDSLDEIATSLPHATCHEISKKDKKKITALKKSIKHMTRGYRFDLIRASSLLKGI